MIDSPKNKHSLGKRNITCTNRRDLTVFSFNQCIQKILIYYNVKYYFETFLVVGISLASNSTFFSVCSVCNVLKCVTLSYLSLGPGYILKNKTLSLNLFCPQVSFKTFSLIYYLTSLSHITVKMSSGVLWQKWRWSGLELIQMNGTVINQLYVFRHLQMKQ